MEIDLQILKILILKVKRLIRDLTAIPHNKIGNRNAQLKEDEEHQE